MLGETKIAVVPDMTDIGSSLPPSLLCARANDGSCPQKEQVALSRVSLKCPRRCRSSPKTWLTPCEFYIASDAVFIDPGARSARKSARRPKFGAASCDRDYSVPCPEQFVNIGLAMGGLMLV